MSSPTVTGPTIADSWIHMHQQGYGAQQSTMDSGRYTKSTASSRSRASSKLTSRKSFKELMQSVDEDSGMSRDGIYEAFAQMENDDFEPQEAAAASTRRAGGGGMETTVRLRRKSRVPVTDDESTMRTNVKRASVNTSQGNNESPRARPLNTKKSIESITRRRASAAAQPSPRTGPTKVNAAAAAATTKSRYSSTTADTEANSSGSRLAADYRRRRSIPDNSSGGDVRSLRSGGSSNSGKSSMHDGSSSSSSSGGGNVIKLADALRDSLIVERKLARQELGLCSDKTDPSSHAPGERTRAALKSPPSDAAAAAAATSTTTPTSTTAANNTNRKTSVLLSGRRASARLDQQRRKSVHDDSQRTTAEIISDAKRRLSLGKEKMRDVERAAAASVAAKAAKEPRRRTLSSGSILRTGVLKDELERRRSTASRGTPPSSSGESYMRPTIADLRRRSSVANGDEREESLVMLATKRRSALASSRASRRGDQSGSRASSASSSGGGGQGTTPGPDDDGSAKKSAAALRRQSRGSDASSTETASTKTSAAARSRKKSIVAMDDSSLGVRRVRRMSRTESLKEGVPTSPSLNAALAWRKKSQAVQEQTSKGVSSARAAFENNRTVRKRGKTLPGSLATPPPVQSLLPPMKVEPIKLSIPKSSSGKDASTPTTRVPKPSSSKTIGRPDASRTPSTGRGGSSEEEATKAVPSGDRRSSLKTTASRITPAASPRENVAITASPRTRPVATSQIASARKLSLSTVNSKTGISASEEASPSLGPYSAGLLPPRSRKISTSSMNAASSARLAAAAAAAASSGGSSRKNSLASVTDQDVISCSEKEKERHRAMSLQERLQAMVAQHAIQDDYANADLQYSFLRERRARKSQTYDYEDRADDDGGLRSPTSAAALMWEKEIAEIAAAGVRGPKSPTTALKYYAPYLSLYERTEILEYGQIYFIGDQAQKHPATLDKPERNFGYDDERGDYNIVPRDHLAYRYEVLDVLGRGSFGQVVKCLDHKTGMSVAIKLIRNKKRFHAQAQTEVKILKDLVEWDPHDQHHNIRMTDYFTFRNHLCIACECLSINLYEFIKANNYRGFSLSLIKRFTIQLLRSLCLLYEHGVIHCDLKPENILLKHPSKSTIKVIDFGSSCFENDRVYTYIQSRFYRSPEVILGMSYNMAIDMWSLGCILAELYTGLPLFPGENEQEQLACIMEILGMPSRYLIEQSARRKLFFDSSGNPRIIPNSRGKKRRPGSKTLAQALRCNDALFLDFVARCLHWDPEKRMTPEEAIFHDWILSSSRHSSGGSKQQQQATSPSRVLSCVQIGTEDTPRMLAVADNKQCDDTELKKQQ